jgi:FixJ family two-component response regulator
MLNKQIAAALGCSIRTVKIHRARTMEKMQVDSLADLVRAAELLRTDRVPPPEPRRRAEPA